MSCLGGGGPGRRGAVHDWYRILQLPKNRCWTLGSSNTSARENSADSSVAAVVGCWSGRLTLKAAALAMQCSTSR